MLYILIAILAVTCCGVTFFATKNILAKRFEVQSQLENQRRTALSRAASHELVTPLNNILGLIGSLTPEKDRLGKRGQEALEHLEDSGKSLHKLLVDVFDIYNISSGNITLEPSTFSLHKVIETNIRLISNSLDGKPLQFNLQMHEDISIISDRVYFVQSLRTLLKQAVYQSTSGTITVYVSSQMSSNTGMIDISIEVSDESSGMDQYQADKYFLPESYEQNPTLRGRPSAMLSLNLAKGIAEVLGGTMSATSKVGSGVTFNWEFAAEFVSRQSITPVDVKPKYSVMISAENVTAPTASPETALEPAMSHVAVDHAVRLDGARVLIIDDNETNLVVLEAFLDEYHPAAIFKATSGHEALDLARNTEFDLVLTDIQMPDLDGFETTAQMKALSSHYASVPIVGISAGSKFDNIPKCKNAGMVGYLEKPLARAALTETLNSVNQLVSRSIKRRDEVTTQAA